MPEDLSGTALDHIIPKSRGGPGKRWNHQRLHAACNMAKGSKLTPEAIELAAKYGVILHEPLPTSWPGSNSTDAYGKPNPHRVARDPGDPPSAYTPQPARPELHKVTVRKIYEVECRTCGCVIAVEDSWKKGLGAKRDHVALCRGDRDA